MYNRALPAYVGAKGGSQPKPHTPVTSPDSLISTSYAKVLVAVAEGELAGQPTAKDIFLGGTPLESANGTKNFGGVKWEWRSGTQNQTYIQGIPDVNNEITVGLEVTTEVTFNRLITTPNLSAVRINLGFPAIFEQKDNGDVTGYTFQYAIDLSTNGGAFTEYQRYTVSGKASSEYNRSHRVDLPQNGTFWDVRVRRITPNKNDGRIGDKMFVRTYTEIIDAKFRYPNTALLYVEFDASLFGGNTIPAISVKTKGRYVRVPTNYDPDSRTYSGVWNGTFKWAWSDNPTWVFYDIVLEPRFGLGSRIDQTQIDKWTLYKVSQYCDVLVSDGRGGLEPRHTCNVYIQSRKEAWAVLRDITSIFNGMIYWDGTQIVANADMPVDTTAVRTYNRSMVVDGEFNYSSTSERTIYTTALVSYDDPDNHFETAVEPVNESSLVKRYRTWAQTELSAIGCTSRGEAQRKGKYTMITNGYNRVVSFQLGIDGYLPRPSEVFGVADQLLAGKQFAGRILKVISPTQIIVDRPIGEGFEEAGSILYINTEDGRSQGRTISFVEAVPRPGTEAALKYAGANDWYAGEIDWVIGIGGNPMYVITLTTEYTLTPEPELGWYIESENLKSQLFRCNKISWNEDSNTFDIIGTEYNDSKYGAVDNGVRLEDRPISQIPISAQEQVGVISVNSYSYVEQGLSVTSMTASWDAVPGAVKYECEWRKDGGDWKNVGTIGETSFDVYGIYTGSYIVRVRAISSFDTKSLWKESLPTQLNGKVGAPPALASFTTESVVFGIKLNWQFSEGSEDGAYVQIQESNVISGAMATELGFIPYPQISYNKTGMAAAVVKFFRARLVDRSGNEGTWTAWTYGISSADASDILDYIAGQITETQLGENLLSEIEQIDINKINTQLNKVAIDASNILIQVNKTAIETETTVRQQADNALAQQITTVSAVTDQNKAAIQTETAARTSADSALAQQIQTLVAANSSNMAAIQTESSARVEADNALASQITTVQSSTITAQNTADGKGKIYTQPTQPPVSERLPQNLWIDTTSGKNTPKRWNGSAWVAVTDKVATDAATAAASALSGVATNTAAIQNEVNARTNADSALSSQINTVSASTALKNRTYRQSTAPSTGLVTGDLWYNSADGNKLSRWTGSAWVATDDTRIAANFAAIQTETTARTTADSALASQITTAQATANGATATAQTALTTSNSTKDGLNAMYSIKLGINQDGKYYGAGMGIGIENTPSGLQSQVLFVADRFAILNNINGVATSPFVVQNGQTIINTAVIGNATIQFAKIGDDVQSTNYIPNVQGWRLGKAGSLEFNGTVAGGGRMTINNQVLQVYDTNGTLRVRLGIWS